MISRSLLNLDQAFAYTTLEIRVGHTRRHAKPLDKVALRHTFLILDSLEDFQGDRLFPAPCS